MILLYAESKKEMIQMNLFTKEKQTHRPREGTYAYQGEGRREGNLGWTSTHCYI